MKSRWLNVGIGLLLMGVLMSVSTGTLAAQWPARPISVIVPWAAGGGTDITARLVFSYVEKIFGQKVIIVNKTGAGGEIGFTELALSKPDGYTWGWTNAPLAQSYPLMHATKYKWDDFEFCCNIINDPGVIVVPANSQFKTIQELLDFAKKHPSVVTIGNTGTGSDDYIAVRTMERVAGVKVTQVPFEGAAPQTTAVLGGHISAGAINASEAKPYVEAGKMRVLAVMDEKRCHLLPDVPTFKEIGYNVVSGSSRGFSAPKGTPPEIIEKMAKAVEETMKNPEFLEKAEKAYQLLDFKPPAVYREYMKRVQEDLEKMYKEHPW